MNKHQHKLYFTTLTNRMATAAKEMQLTVMSQRRNIKTGQYLPLLSSIGVMVTPSLFS